MFGLKIVTKKRWDELNLLLAIQAETILHSAEILDDVVTKVTEVCDKVVSSDDKTHS